MSGGSNDDDVETSPLRAAQAEEPKTIRKARNYHFNNDNIEGACLDDEDDPPTDDEVEEDLTVMGAQPCQHPALAEGSRQSPPTTRQRLATNGSVGTDSSDDKDTKPTAAEKKKKSKKSKQDCVREDTKRKLEQDVNEKVSNTVKNEVEACREEGRDQGKDGQQAPQGEEVREEA